MIVKLAVGITRKIGQSQYGSLSASCNAEVELPDHLLDDHDAIQPGLKS